MDESNTNGVYVPPPEQIRERIVQRRAELANLKRLLKLCVAADRAKTDRSSNGHTSRQEVANAGR